MELKSILEVAVAIATLCGCCFPLCNYVFKFFRRRSPGKVRVRKITREDGIDIGFAASAVNTGEATFTVSGFRMFDGEGQTIRPFVMDGCDKLPKVVHPGEQCQIKCFSIDDEHPAVTGNVERVVFILATGEELSSKKLPYNIDPV